MVLQGAKRCLKVPSRYVKSPFWAHQISAASSQPSTHKMKAAGIKSQVGGPAAEGVALKIYIYIPVEARETGKRRGERLCMISKIGRSR